MNKITILLSVLFIVNTDLINTQIGDNLEPVGSVYGKAYNYHSKVRQVLYNGLSDTQILQFLLFPSLGAEAVLSFESVNIDLNTEKYYLNYHVSQTSIWQSLCNKEEWQDIEVKKIRKEISPESVKLLLRLFQVALSQTQYTGKAGLDGTSYYFVNLAIAGKTWSPPDGTKMKRLVDINLEIIDMVKSEALYLSLSSDMRSEITALMNAFESVEN